MSKDYYSVLGVNRSATDDEVKAAYRKLAKKYHPDTNPNDKTLEVKFKEVNEAYDAIKNGQASPQYSNSYSNSFHQSSTRSSNRRNFNEVFEEMFANDFGEFFNYRQRTFHNESYNVEITLTLEEVFTGVEKDLNLKLPNGEIRKLKVNIPRSVSNGHRLILKGKGGHSNTQIPPGDIQIQCKVIDHSYFKRHVNNLLAEIKISVFDMMLGCEKEISTIDGGKISLKIPAGTNDGTILRVANKGLYSHHGNKRGDLMVKIASIIPKIKNEDINLVRQLHQKYP